MQTERSGQSKNWYPHTNTCHLVPYSTSVVMALV